MASADLVPYVAHNPHSSRGVGRVRGYDPGLGGRGGQGGGRSAGQRAARDGWPAEPRSRLGEAQADDPVLDVLLVLGRDDVERLMVDRALAEVPGALRELRLLDELEHAAVALLVADPEPGVRAFGAEQLAAHALGDEVGHRL